MSLNKEVLFLTLETSEWRQEEALGLLFPHLGVRPWVVPWPLGDLVPHV